MGSTHFDLQDKSDQFLSNNKIILLEKSFSQDKKKITPNLQNLFYSNIRKGIETEREKKFFK